MSTIHSITFNEFIRITFEQHMTVLGPDDNYPNSSWICAWCNARIFVGTPYRMVPEDLRAWFLSPQQFEELCKILQDEGEQLLPSPPLSDLVGSTPTIGTAFDSWKDSMS